MKTEGVRCKHKATTACSPNEGVGLMLLSQGRVVSDCGPLSHFFLSLSLSFSPFASSVFLCIFLSFSLSSLSFLPPCLLPPISSPQREKRWSISSAGGEKNSSSVSRGVFGRKKERDERGLWGKEGMEAGRDVKVNGQTRSSSTIALAQSPRDKVGLNCSITHTPALQNVPSPAFSMQIGSQIMPFVFILPTVRL